MGRDDHHDDEAPLEREPSDSGWRLTMPERGPPRVRPVRRRRMKVVVQADGKEVVEPVLWACRFCGKRFADKAWMLYHPCAQERFRPLVLADFPTPPTKARKCSTFARARTINLEQVTIDAAAAMAADGRARRHPRKLPMLREECLQMERPCGYVSCRHHNAFGVDENNGSIKENLPQLRIYDEPDGPGLLVLEMVMGTCGLDLSDGNDDGSQGVSGLEELRALAEDGLPIGNTDHGLSLKEASDALQLSFERIRQIGAKAMQKVRIDLYRQQGGERLSERRTSTDSDVGSLPSEITGWEEVDEAVADYLPPRPEDAAAPARPIAEPPPALVLWVIYEHPAEHPGHYVLQRWAIDEDGEVTVDEKPAALVGTIEEARAALPPGCKKVKPSSDLLPDPTIAEVWR